MGAISLEKVVSKELSISHCYFISCSNEADINFKSRRGIIQYCKFLYNPNDVKANGVILYENPEPAQDDILAIRQCFFEYNDPTGTSVFLSFKSNSKFELTYNAFKVYYYNDDDTLTETRILKCSDKSESVDIRKYPIKGNTLYPFEKELIGNNIKYPFNGFIRPRDSECPGLPDDVDNTGENEVCSIIGGGTEDRLVDSSTIVSIYYSSFTSNGNNDNLGGAVYVQISSDLNVNIETPIEIYYSSFVKCIAKCGCGIYLESKQDSRLFDIHRCSFISNNNDNSAQCQGAGIYIKSSLSTFKISRCFFKDNKASEGGGIYFTNDESTSSKSLLDTYEEDIKFTLNVKDCVFISNSANENSGAVYIKITNTKSLKPIEINSCIFLANMNKQGGAIYYSFDSPSSAGDTSYTFHVYNSVFEDNAVTESGGSIFVTVLNKDVYNPIEIDNCSFSTNKAKNGGCIYYNYPSATTMRSSLLDDTEDLTNYGFHVTACLFTENEATINGGAIAMEISQNLIKPIKIDYCSFSGNKATDTKALGADIYYNAYSGAKSSKNLLANEQSLKVIDCNFSKSYSANAGGSIYIYDIQPSKEIEINNCVFDGCSSVSECALDIHSDVETVPFHIVGCSFKNEQAINFKAINGLVELCNFKDISKAVQYDYQSNTQSSSKLVFDKCTFEQTTDKGITALFKIAIKEHSMLDFTNNHVSISVDKVAVFDCDIESTYNFNWNVENNELSPQEEKYVKTKIAAKLPITCESFNFICEEPPEEPLPKDECSPKPGDFKDTDFYACKMIIKSQVVLEGQLILDHCNFTNFKESIAVSVSKYKDLNGIINIDVCNFVHCQKGAISLDNVESKELNISHCYFISCSEKSDVIKFTSKRGIIQYCKFLNNKIIEEKFSDTTFGVIHYENPSTAQDDILAIRQCFFEYNDPFDKSIFLTFKSNSKFELTYNAFKVYYYNEDTPIETRILKCSDGSESESINIKDYTIKGNTLFPFKEELIGSKIIYPSFGFIKTRISDCPKLPEGIESKNVLCSSIGEKTGYPSIQSHTIVSIYYSSFLENGNKDSLGGAVYVSISELSVDKKTPIEIYYSAFSQCIAKCGCGIYLESTEASRLFDIHRCSFISNTDDISSPQCQGAGIYIKSSSSTFKISRCYFSDNKALEGGGIYFTNDESTSSKSLLDTYEEDIKFTLNVKDCVFYSNSVNDYGGAVCIKITNAESLKPIVINSCIFLKNMNKESEDNEEERGAAIYYSFGSEKSGSSGYRFRVYNSVFEENEVNDLGGSIYVTVLKTEPYNPIEVDNCSFGANKAPTGGCICYDYATATTTASTTEESKYCFHVTACLFNEIVENTDSVGIDKGGCIALIMRSSEPSKTILIDDCTFANSKLSKNGCSIYYECLSSQSDLSTITDPVLFVNKCTFSSESNSESTPNTENGGSIYISTKSQYPRQIEINGSTFKSSSAKTQGGSIYYSLDSASSETTSSVLKIANCDFTESHAQGGSIYMVANSGGQKQIEINHCSFDKSGSSTDTDSIYIKSESKTVTFNVIDCDFVSNSIFFEALSGSIDSCRFSNYDAGKHAVKYLRDSIVPTLEATLSISNCDFKQTKTDEVSLIYFEKSPKSKFSFTDNTIVFQDEKSHVLDCPSEDIVSGIDENYWHFHNNTITPPIYEIIKTSAAESIPAGCGDQFSCPVETPTKEPSIEESIEESQSKEPPSEEPSLEQSSSAELPPEESSSEEFSSESESLSEEPPTDGNCVGNNPCNKTYTDGEEDYINITDRDYKELPSRKTGAAIRLLNYSLICLKTNFTNCEVTHGGGGIFIILQKTLSMPVLFENLTFKHCRAVYGGAVYIYSDRSENLITITSCIFEDNTASKKQQQGFESHLYGGAACFLQTTNSNITNCLFNKNHGSGLKIFNDFDAPPKEIARILENDQQVSLSIKDCLFEAEKDSSSSSLFFVRGLNYEYPIEVKDCTFKGELKTGTYHIDGDSLSLNKKEKSKLHIMSCKFSSNEEYALSKKPMLFDSVDRNSQLFNYKEIEDVNVVHYVEQKMSKKSNNNNNLSVIVTAATVFAVVAVIAAMAIIIMKLKSQTSNDENIDNDNVIELNAAEL